MTKMVVRKETFKLASYLQNARELRKRTLYEWVTMMKISLMIHSYIYFIFWNDYLNEYVTSLLEVFSLWEGN